MSYLEVIEPISTYHQFWHSLEGNITVYNQNIVKICWQSHTTYNHNHIFQGTTTKNVILRSFFISHQRAAGLTLFLIKADQITVHSQCFVRSRKLRILSNKQLISVIVIFAQFDAEVARYPLNKNNIAKFNN